MPSVEMGSEAEWIAFDLIELAGRDENNNLQIPTLRRSRALDLEVCYFIGNAAAGRGKLLKRLMS
jgi:hypothetical protein